MTKRNTFGERDLLDVLGEIGARLKGRVRISLIGGCAMTFMGSKTATKDIDVVVYSDADAQNLVRAMRGAGFARVDSKAGSEYKSLDAWAIMERKRDGMRFDVFQGTVCDKVEISSDMQSRSAFYKRFVNLDVYLMSKEDIVFFKGMTERDGDLDDMRLLAEGGLDWKTIEEECKSQREGGKWARMLTERLIELKERHGIEAPRRIMQSLMDHGDLDLLQMVFSKIIGKEAVTTTTIIAEIKDKYYYSPSWTRKQLDVLEKKNFLKKEKSGRTYLYSIR